MVALEINKKQMSMNLNSFLPAIDFTVTVLAIIMWKML